MAFLITTVPAFFIGARVIVLCFLFAGTIIGIIARLRSTKQPSSIPVVGNENNLDFRAALIEGQRLYPDRPFAIPTTPFTVVLPLPWIQTLKSAPESQLSASKEVHRRALGQYTDLGKPMPELFTAIKVDMTRNVRNLIPKLEEQAVYAFDHCLPSKSEKDWVPVTGYVFVKEVVTILNALAFVGPDLSRDSCWQDIACHYVDEVTAAIGVIKRWPAWLRPLVAHFEMQKLGVGDRRRRVREILLPYMMTADSKVSDQPTLMNFIRCRLGYGRGDDVELLARMQLRAALASSNTVSQVVTNILFDLASMPDYIAPLRDEIMQCRLASGNEVSKTLRGLSKMDSFIKESIRVSPGYQVAMGRITTSPLQLDGFAVPKHTTVYFNMLHSYNSPDYQHGTDTSIFDGFRYDKLRREKGLMNFSLATTTGVDHLAFGHGTEACPGRFVAVAIIKIFLSHLLLNYDISLPQENRPQQRWAGLAGLLDTKAELLFKRRYIV